jgi:hypothetical protein
MGRVLFTGSTAGGLTNNTEYDLVAVAIKSGNDVGVVVLDDNGQFSPILSYSDYTVTELYGTRKVV